MMDAILSPSSESTKGHAEKLIEKIIEEVSAGPARILLWGLDSTCLSILKELSSLGILSAVIAIVDPENIGKEVFSFKVKSPLDVRTLDFDTLVITSDSRKESALAEFSRMDSRLPRVIIAGTKHLEFSDPMFYNILESCPVRPRAFGYPNMLIHIYQSLKYLVHNKIEGAAAEFGVYQGGTAAFIAKTLRAFGSRSQIYGFDTFTGFPRRESILDMFRERKYELTDYDTVTNYLSPLGVQLVRGDIKDTFEKLRSIPLMFTFFDTDNYTPTRKALELCYEQTVKGGILAFDHYYCDERWVHTVGERMATNEVLSKKNTFHIQGTGIFLKP